MLLVVVVIKLDVTQAKPPAKRNTTWHGGPEQGLVPLPLALFSGSDHKNYIR